MQVIRRIKDTFLNYDEGVGRGHGGGAKRGAKLGKAGVKRKGRLPSRIVINKSGKKQRVYYRPDQKTRSKYIDPAKKSPADLMMDYGESFKRMLFRDHDGRRS